MNLNVLGILMGKIIHYNKKQEEIITKEQCGWGRQGMLEYINFEQKKFRT